MVLFFEMYADWMLFLPHLTVEGIGVCNHLLQTTFHAIDTVCAGVEVVDWQHHCSGHELIVECVSVHVFLLSSFSVKLREIMLERESFTVSWVVFLGGPAMAFLDGFGSTDAVNSQRSG